jgi:hypothetical protein
VIFSFYFKSTDSGIIYSSTGLNNVPEIRIELYSNGSIYFRIWTALCGIAVFSGPGFNDGSWHHVEAYFNGITSKPTLEIWVDEEFENSITVWLCEIENDDFRLTKMGKRASDSSLRYKGYIDEFKITKYEAGNEQNPPIIDGPTHGEAGVEHDYTFLTNDPEGDEW